MELGQAKGFSEKLQVFSKISKDFTPVHNIKQSVHAMWPKKEKFLPIYYVKEQIVTDGSCGWKRLIQFSIVRDKIRESDGDSNMR